MFKAKKEGRFLAATSRQLTGHRLPLRVESMASVKLPPTTSGTILSFFSSNKGCRAICLTIRVFLTRPKSMAKRRRAMAQLISLPRSAYSEAQNNSGQISKNSVMTRRSVNKLITLGMAHGLTQTLDLTHQSFETDGTSGNYPKGSEVIIVETSDTQATTTTEWPTI